MDEQEKNPYFIPPEDPPPEEKPEPQPLPPDVEGVGFSKHGKRLLDPDTVKRMKDAGIPRPPEVSSLSWDQLQSLSVGRHHTIAYMAACGATQKDIADAVGMEPGSICKIVNSEKMKFEIERLQHKLFGVDAQARFRNLMPKAINTIESIMDDKRVKDSIRLSAAINLVDRAVGKPAQHLEVGGSLIRQLFEKLDEKHKVIDTEPVQSHSESDMEKIIEECDLGANPNEVERRDQEGNPNFDEDDTIEQWVGENT